MITKFLINRDNLQIAVKLEECNQGKKLTILDENIIRIIKVCGINVPRSFTPDRSCHIYLDCPDQNLFARAFEQHFYPHGLMQKGFFWLKEEDYYKESSIWNMYKNKDDYFIKRHILPYYPKDQIGSSF
ncbi:MAG: hypothetical protein KBA81_02845 [Rhabdochlamydiaceae bacterium]|nr:hypothetical protein [Rhabdochlamydiaceae bacterium]